MWNIIKRWSGYYDKALIDDPCRAEVDEAIDGYLERQGFVLNK